MRAGAFTAAVVSGLLFLTSHASPIEQRWSVTLGSIEAQPCIDAKITLNLTTASGEFVSTFPVPLDLNALGVGTVVWQLQIPDPGDYFLVVRDHGCSEEDRSRTAIPVRVTEREISMFAEPAAQHHRPHFHAYYQDAAAVFACDAIEVLGGELPQRQRRFGRSMGRDSSG